ncbi:hypothetical protein GIB67_012311 [Kingdonia uniflora]|uniref:Uncharacterized protein n=1 Tax=Kingdonia uniflora TaxID=39325 RepID=A0A7J7MVM8_9MAGN|nr:hypothetical protein GIB67_012311 [Kingdonia uniflora]
MKTSFLLSLYLCFNYRLSLFLFSLAIESLVIFANSATKTIHDVTGQKLQAGTEYYILVVFQGNGGLTAGSPKNWTFPFDVVQEQHEVSNGLPLILSPVK